MLKFDAGLALTERVLDAAATRTKVCLHNVANRGTPGFKRYVVEFEQLLREAQQRGQNPGDVLPIVKRDESGLPGANNVSLVAEMTLLDKVSLIHEVFARRAGSYFNKLNRAIAGRV